ncbi:MAG: deiodinase-like protein [Myxococcota bacterium]
MCLGANACLPTQPTRHLLHFAEEAPAEGSFAPDVAVRDLDGAERRLSEWIGERPVVLQLGSYSCPLFRQRRHWMNRMAEGWSDRVQFLVVYTQEAHPIDAASPWTPEVWDPWVNGWSGVRMTKAVSWQERRDAAERAQSELDLAMPVLLDRMTDDAWRQYGRAPSPAFVIDRNGRITLRQVWVNPGPIHDELRRLVAEPSEAP